MTDDTCSSCMHDRRSAKKTAVSIVYSNDEVSADLIWLTMFHTDGCQIDSNPEHSGYQLRRNQRVTTLTTSYSPCTNEWAIGNPNENPRRGVRDPRVIDKSQVNQPRLVRDPIGLVAMSNYSQVIGSAQHDLNDISSILITLRNNGKHGAIPTMYREYDPTISMQSA